MRSYKTSSTPTCRWILLLCFWLGVGQPIQTWGLWIVQGSPSFSRWKRSTARLLSLHFEVVSAVICTMVVIAAATPWFLVAAWILRTLASTCLLGGILMWLSPLTQKLIREISRSPACWGNARHAHVSDWSPTKWYRIPFHFHSPFRPSGGLDRIMGGLEWIDFSGFRWCDVFFGSPGFSLSVINEVK